MENINHKEGKENHAESVKRNNQLKVEDILYQPKVRALENPQK